MTISYKKFKEKIHSTLRDKERSIKTDMVYLASGGFWLFTAQVLSFLFSFSLSIAFANLLSKDVFGNYRYILALGTSLSAFTLTGMNTAVSQAVARGFEGVYRKSVEAQIKWGVVTLLMTSVVSLWYYFHNNYIFALGVLIIGCSLPFINSYNTYAAFLTGKKDFSRLFLYSTYISFFSNITIFIVLIISHNFIAMLLAYSISNSVLNYYFHKKIEAESGHKIDETTISYGNHLSVSNWLSVFIQQIELILIFQFLGESSLANYYFIALFPDYMKHAFKTLPTLAMPRFAIREFNDLKKTLLQKTSLIFILLSVIYICYLIISPYIFQIFFPKYTDLLNYSRIYALSIFIVISSIPVSILNAKKLIKETYYFNIISSAIKAIFSFASIILFGLLGLVWSVVLYSWLYVIFSMCIILFKKNTDE